MSKRRRDAEAIEKPDKANDKETSIEEKRAKASSDGEEMKSSSDELLTASPGPEESHPQRNKGPSKKNENLSDLEERPELRAQKSLDGEDSASDKGSVMEETNNHLYQDLLDGVLKMKDSNGRMICELFLKLPPRQQYPEYYRVIKEPIDLKIIYSQVKNNGYTSMDEIERDLNLLVKNAHAFNEPGSQVYKDATAIKKTVVTKRLEIEHTLSGAKSSKRLRSKRSTSKMSFAINALLSESDDEDEDLLNDATQLLEEDEVNKNTDGDSEDPFLTLYNSVRMYADYSGRILSEAFMRLPSKRAYPDYYDVIKNPIGLLKIGSNIKNNYFESLDELVAEMNQCFQNAKIYNETESMLFQDGMTLQDILKSKKAEIEKMCLDKGIPLTRPVNKKIQKTSESPSEEGDTDGKDTPMSAGRIQNKKSGKKLSESEAFKKRMREMYDAVKKYQDDNGRFLSELFFELPSAALYPDYYEIITEPTCLHMIDKNIQEGKYQTEQQFLLDFEIMFENAKHYNEIGSQVHQDALTLDKVLKKKRKSLGRSSFGQIESGASPAPAAKQSSTGSKQTTPTKSRFGRTSQAGATSDVKELCKEMYNSVKDYTDNTGRYLCGIFQKLPAKADYPDYYALIKRPIDMTKIAGKLHAEQYSSLEESFQDFVLMFDNACKYNDPDSQVYKDSLVLLRELLATKLELLGDCELHVPDVPDLVQKMLEDLYNAVIHHQDDEGRCYSDSLLKLTTAQEVNESGQKRHILSLRTIGKLIQKRYYKRLDKLQEDLYAFFEKARTHRSDSEVYDDAVELQQFYVQQRDRVCKDGERFVSPAISQTKRHLQHELDEERKRKTKEEASDAMDVDVAKDEDGVTELPEAKLDDLEIAIGDFVYVDAEGGRFVIGVEKIWSDKDEVKWINGSWFYRPEQTVCDGDRKFIEKEVVRSDKKSGVKVNQLKGLCYVMHVKNYARSKPHDFEDKDIFVCECAYNVSRQLFKKIKSWPGGHGHTMRYVPRDQPLHLKRTPLDPSKTGGTEEKDDEDLMTSLFQATEERKNLQIELPNPEGFLNYEQFCTNTGCYKLGDTVLCQTDEGYSTIARIDKIWTDRTSMTYFCGTTFIMPDDTQHLPTHMFYDKEVFHVPVDDIYRICDIQRKYFVLPIREYMRCRPTDVPEEDVFLCESRYDEDEGGHYRKLKGLKRPTLSTSVYEEEFYFFEENLNLVKKPSPLLVKDLSELRRDDRIVSPSSSSTGDAESGKSAKKRSRPQSGFLVFSAERRGVLRKQYPDHGFGDISRLVGTEWKNLSPMKREEWEARAISQAAIKAQVPVTSPPPSYFTGPGMAYDCLWQGCDYQYEDLNELVIHFLESGGHLIKMDSGICPCVWRNCERLKRGMRPFNSLTKVIRHCREVHLKGPPRRVEFHERSKNYFPKNQAPVQPERPAPSPVPTNMNQAAGNQAFVGVVPSPTPSNVLGGGPSINMNSSLLDQQFSNVMRMPTPALAQNMMNLTNAYGNQGMSTLPSQNTVNLQRSPAIMNGSPLPPGAVNQFAQMSSMAGSNMAQQQFANTLQQFSSAYQQQQQQQQQQEQLPPPYPSMPLAPQQTQMSQPRPQAPPQNQQTMFPMQRPQPMETQTSDIQMAPLFHSPPPRQQRLLHSDAYLRYIEGLRDGTPHLSNWNPNKPDVTKLTPQQQSQLPVQWLGSAYNPHSSTVEALWALREHMLNDTLKLAKFSQDTT